MTARTILVLAPHPDDAALYASGVIYAAHQRGDVVKIAFLTNGDFYTDIDDHYVERGLKLEEETVASMAELGPQAEDLLFLGYGDTTTEFIYHRKDETSVVTSPAGVSATYAQYGLNRQSFHETVFGSPAPYVRGNIRADFRKILEIHRPDEIFATHLVDENPDHAGVYLFLYDALVAFSRTEMGKFYNPAVYCGIVHAPNESDWPQKPGSQSKPFARPKYLELTARRPGF
ncbi:MAG: PIG-L family deacetylase [Deltaproteobacteria bacterium]|nr:PIG-L family deacetylase [Deltaproteobacteria bacterium]MBI3295487.1 PIG-L family deacetylase [Deltaproteobacteria bacterium]